MKQPEELASAAVVTSSFLVRFSDICHNLTRLLRLNDTKMRFQREQLAPQSTRWIDGATLPQGRGIETERCGKEQGEWKERKDERDFHLEKNMISRRLYMLVYNELN